MLGYLKSLSAELARIIDQLKEILRLRKELEEEKIVGLGVKVNHPVDRT